MCGSKYVIKQSNDLPNFCLDCDREIPEHVVQAAALHAALGTIAALVQRDSTANPGEPTSLELEFENGEWIAEITWWHHDGPIDEAEARSAESYEAAIIALAAKVREQAWREQAQQRANGDSPIGADAHERD